MTDTKQIVEIFDHEGNQVKEGSILTNKQASRTKYVCLVTWGIVTKGKTTDQKWSCVPWLRFVKLPFPGLKKTEEDLKKSLLPEYFEPKFDAIPLRGEWLFTPYINRRKTGGRLDEVMYFLPHETTMNQSCFKNYCLWQTTGDTIDMKAIREAVIENGDENFERYKSPHNILKKYLKNFDFSKAKLKITKYPEGIDD